MFTGIVQGLGTIQSNSSGILVIDDYTQPDWQLGESIAINGCCLTVVDFSQGLRFELSPETLTRTALGALKRGEKVNVERAMRPMDRLGGHFVQGHVDAVGTISAIQPEGNSTVFTFAAPPEHARYLIDKGSICIDGISLTVVSPQDATFEVWVIPHTLQNTSLGDARIGQNVNLEFDMLAKYVEKLIHDR